MTMPRTPRLGSLVWLLWLSNSVVARTWRPHTVLPPYCRDGVPSRSITSASITSFDSTPVCSGGSCSLPSATPENSNSTANIIRGGSATRTRKREGVETQPLVSVFTNAVLPPTAGLKSSSSTLNAAVVDNDTIVETQPLESVEKSKEKKEKKWFFLGKSAKSHKQIAQKLKNRNHTNLRRKLLHCAFGLTFAFLNHCVPRAKFVPGMAILSSATLLMELLRYRKGFGWMNQALHFVLGSSLRKHEMEGKFTGSFYFFTGVTLTAALYPQHCATMGICQLAIADPSASYFGRRTRHVYWSRIENGLGGIGRNKGFLGFLGGALFCFPFNYRVLAIARQGAGTLPGGQTAIVVASLLLGFAGALADLAVPTPALVLPKKILGMRVPPFHVDDNMVVPIFSGYACTKVFQMLGWSDLELARWLIAR